MDTEILQFVEQAERSLSKIRGGILLCAREKNLYGELNSTIRQVASVRDAASVSGFEEIEKFASSLKENLKLFAGTKEKLADEQARQFLDEITWLETLVAKVNFSLSDFSMDLTDFVDDYFENIQAGQLAQEINRETAAETGRRRT